MKYNVGDRLIWIDDKEDFIIDSSFTLRGTVINKYREFIDIRWENGRVLTYDKEEKRIQIDKEYYRNEKLEKLGI